MKRWRFRVAGAGSVWAALTLFLWAETPSSLQRALEAAKAGDAKAALPLLRTEAQNGSAEAATALAEYLLSGRAGKADPAEALRWLQQAADALHPPAMLNLAILLKTGAPGAPADPEKARFLLRAAAETGYAPAQAAWGAELNEEAVRADTPSTFAEAREWFEKAAAQEQPDALFALVRYHDEGLGGAERSPQKATEFCRQAAKTGSVLAMNEMGVRYQRGTGLVQDPVAAIGWFTLAAQYGLPGAEVNLGHCYAMGNGVRQDYGKAGAQYAAAAKRGFGPAEFLLGQLFERGQGTAMNLSSAYALYTRAAANGVAEAAVSRDAIESQLTPAQLSEAKKMLTPAGKSAQAKATPPPKR